MFLSYLIYLHWFPTFVSLHKKWWVTEGKYNKTLNPSIHIYNQSCLNHSCAIHTIFVLFCHDLSPLALLCSCLSSRGCWSSHFLSDYLTCSLLPVNPSVWFAVNSSHLSLMLPSLSVCICVCPSSTPLSVIVNVSVNASSWFLLVLVFGITYPVSSSINLFSLSLFLPVLILLLLFVCFCSKIKCPLFTYSCIWIIILSQHSVMTYMFTLHYVYIFIFELSLIFVLWKYLCICVLCLLCVFFWLNGHAEWASHCIASLTVYCAHDNELSNLESTRCLAGLINSSIG